ncbi:L-lactate permease, partial [Bacillus vallismortis]|nr:L-lactate permease [Bacillus vallismortis]
NAASGAFGAIGIPVITGAQIGDLSALGLSRTLMWTLTMITFFIPFLLVFLLDRIKGIKQTLPAMLVVSGLYTAVQTLT